MKTVLIIMSFLGLQSFTYWIIPATDYRDTYCGNYIGKRIFQTYNSLTQNLSNDTTNYTIVVSKNKKDSILDITIQEGIFQAKLVGDNLQTSDRRYNGSFSGNKIYFTYKIGLGPQSYRYFGTK